MTEPGSAKPEVLIVDDDPRIRGAMRCLLDDSGMVVVGEAGDPRAGVELACRLAPDVVVMDVRMPVLDGLDATRRLAAWLPTTRVIVCTAYGEVAVREQAMRAGAVAIVDKCGHPSRLIGAIEDACVTGRSNPRPVSASAC